MIEHLRYVLTWGNKIVCTAWQTNRRQTAFEYRYMGMPLAMFYYIVIQMNMISC